MGAIKTQTRTIMITRGIEDKNTSFSVLNVFILIIVKEEKGNCKV